AEPLAFGARFRARYRREPSYIAVQGYDAARLAIAAVRAAAADSSAAIDIRAKRDAVRRFLLTLNSPATALVGLGGPLWFTPKRGREQPLRIGRFHGTRFESAPTQLVPVRTPDDVEIASGAV